MITIRSFVRLFAISLLWVVGSLVLLANTVTLVEIHKAEITLKDNIARNLPSGPLDPEGWKGTLKWVQRDKWRSRIGVSLGLGMLASGFILLYWPANWARMFLSAD